MNTFCHTGSTDAVACGLHVQMSRYLHALRLKSEGTSIFSPSKTLAFSIVDEATGKQFLQSFEVRFRILALQDFSPNKKRLAGMNPRGA
jgi:hypothetical protein